MNNIKKHQPILQVLQSANPKLRKAIIKNADDKTICTLVEIVTNLLNGNIPLKSHQRSQLLKFKNSLRKVKACCSKHNKVINKGKARKLLNQSGGALPFLIPLLLPLIAKALLGGVVAAGAGVATKKILGQ
jgi:hypothetical protein